MATLIGNTGITFPDNSVQTTAYTGTASHVATVTAGVSGGSTNTLIYGDSSGVTRFIPAYQFGGGGLNAMPVIYNGIANGGGPGLLNDMGFTTAYTSDTADTIANLYKSGIWMVHDQGYNYTTGPSATFDVDLLANTTLQTQTSGISFFYAIIVGNYQVEGANPSQFVTMGRYGVFSKAAGTITMRINATLWSHQTTSNLPDTKAAFLVNAGVPVLRFNPATGAPSTAFTNYNYLIYKGSLYN